MNIVITLQDHPTEALFNKTEILAKIARALYPQLVATAIAIEPETHPAPPLTDPAQLAAVARCVETLMTYTPEQRSAILNAVNDPNNYAERQ